MKIKSRVGMGPSVSGETIVLDFSRSRETTSLAPDMQGKIVVCLAPTGREFIAKALFLGVAGLILPSIHYRDLAGFAAGEEITVVLIKRFGDETLTEAEEKELGHVNGKNLVITRENNSYALETAS